MFSDIVEPYFLFFLRCSSFLSRLSKELVAACNTLPPACMRTRKKAVPGATSAP